MAIQFVPGIVMTAVGSQYDLSDCPNGAARWLFGAGITYLVSSAASLCYSLCCRSDQEGSDSKLLQSSSTAARLRGCTATLFSFALLIWGSVVVFGSYGKWKDLPGVENKDFQCSEEMPDREYCCPYTPMMMAFVLLLLQWVAVPILVVLGCFCFCCASASAPSAP